MATSGLGYKVLGYKAILILEFIEAKKGFLFVGAKDGMLFLGFEVQVHILA